MYKIIGADGKEYGPVSLEQLKQWMAQGRVNTRTQVQAVGDAGWKTAGEVAELQSAVPEGPPLANSTAEAAVAGLSEGAKPAQGLAITSFVLGLLSLVCFGPLAGLPAVICGHIAHNRTRRNPGQFGGAGFSIAGFVMGYVSILMIPIMAAMLLPALAKAKGRAQSINCANNMKQVGLAFRVWALDHEDKFPFAVSTNQGGSLELASPTKDGDGFDRNPAVHFALLAQELSQPRLLVCPADPSKQAAPDFSHLQAGNVSYRLRSDSTIGGANPQAVVAVCPIHGHQLLADGSVNQTRGWRQGLRPSQSN
jgi:hypothetical protein